MKELQSAYSDLLSRYTVLQDLLVAQRNVERHARELYSAYMIVAEGDHSEDDWFRATQAAKALRAAIQDMDKGHPVAKSRMSAIDRLSTSIYAIVALFEAGILTEGQAAKLMNSGDRVSWRIAREFAIKEMKELLRNDIESHGWYAVLENANAGLPATGEVR